MLAAATAAGPQGVAAYGVDRLLKVAGASVADNMPEARNAARSLLPLIQACSFTYEYKCRALLDVWLPGSGCVTVALVYIPLRMAI